MARTSYSRRADHVQSPPLRSRSSEPRTVSREREEGKEIVIPKRILEEDEEQASKELGGSRHRRAMSDPFDAAAMDEAEAEEKKAESHEQESIDEMALIGMPTLPRFPVTATRNKNCWSEPDIDIFMVRGDNYFDDKKKQPSDPYLMQARGADLFLQDEPVDLEHKSDILLNGRLRKLPTLLINFRFPWGAMLLYYEIPVHLTPYLHNPNGTPTDESLSIQEQTLAEWFKGDTDYKNERLKLIPFVAEGPWVVRNMVTGRPAVIGKKLPVTYEFHGANGHKADLLECTLDIGNSSNTAKRIVNVCRRYMSALTVDIGFVIQAETEDELPEQMLGSIRIHRVDPLKAPKLV